MRIAILSASKDRHARQLGRAFSDAGADSYCFETASIRHDTQARHGLVLPHFGEDLPDAVCLRTMDSGSFEAITRRLGILHGLSELGVVVSNTARAVERCTDKSMTSFLLASAGVPTPRTCTAETQEQARDIIRAHAAPMVLKPLFGSQGKGLQLITDADELPEPQAVGGVYYLQQFMADTGAESWRDYRLMVSRGKVIAGMMRYSAQSWITNIKQGAEALPMPRDAELETLAIAAANAVGAHFCGVDLIRDATGAPYVIEVNSMPAWTGLQAATGLDIAAIRVRDLIADARAAQCETLRRA